MTPILLHTEALSKNFFGVKAVDRVDVQIRKGAIVGLIGPNGSGKTTLFNCVTGHLPTDRGTARFKSTRITGLSASRIALLGIARTFQTVRVFQDLTVRESLLVASQQHQEDNLAGRLLRAPSIRRLEAEAEERAEFASGFVGLGDLFHTPAGMLSYGQRKLLAFAQCLVFDPELILLDEPTAAVNPAMIERMKEQIRNLNDEGLTFFIVEHNMDFIMELADHIIVLDHGRKIAEGKPGEVRSNEVVLEAYFGG